MLQKVLEDLLEGCRSVCFSLLIFFGQYLRMYTNTVHCYCAEVRDFVNITDKAYSKAEILDTEVFSGS